jgi:hypothetical protein
MPSAMLAMVCYSMWTVHTSLHTHSLRREGVLTTRSDSEAIAEEAREFHADEWGNQPSRSNVSFEERQRRPRRRRLAIVQTGVYGAWLWQPTIETIVRPSVADGWVGRL